MTRLAQPIAEPLTEEQRMDARWVAWQARGQASDLWWRRTMRTVVVVMAALVGIAALVYLR